MAEPFHNLCVTWDFDENTKDLYFNTPIIATGQDIYLSLESGNKFFYEIDTQEDTNLFLLEPFINKSIFLDNLKSPFLYVRNIGLYNLTIESSHICNSGSYFLLSEQMPKCIFSGSLSNYILSPNEGLLLGINASQDGTEYFSQAYYPFGFFYEFCNIKEINPSGFYPSCLFCYNDAPSITMPSYSYDIYQTGFCFLDLSDFGSQISSCAEFAGCLRDSSVYCDNFYYHFDAKKCIICNNVYSLFIGDQDDLSYRSYLYTLPSECYSLGSGDYTLELFVKINCIVSDPDGNVFLSIGTDSDYPNFTKIGISNLPQCVGYLNGFSAGSDIYGCCLTTGEWHHLAITKAGNLVSLWMDGLLQNTGLSEQEGLSCPPLFIGSMDAGNRIRPFNGCISNVRIVTGQSLYNGQSYDIPTNFFNEIGYSTCRQITSGIATKILFNSNIIDIGPEFLYENYPSQTDGNPFCENFICFTGFNSSLIVNKNSQEDFLLTGSNFTLETVFNTKFQDGTLISYGGGETGSGCYGDLYNLYLESGCLIFNWRNLCCIESNGLNCIYIDINKFPKSNGFCEWNHVAVSANGNFINMWLNSASCLPKTIDFYDFSGLNCTGFFYIGGSHSKISNFDGCISNIRLLKCSIFDPGCSKFSTVFNWYQSYEDYWTGFSGYTSLLINFPKFQEIPFEFKSFNLNKTVDDCVCLSIDAISCNSTILDGLCQEYLFGRNVYKSNININCLILQTPNCSRIFSNSELCQNLFLSSIIGDCSIKLIYNFDVYNEKYLNYKYFYSGNSGDSCQNIVLQNCPICFNGNTILNTGQYYCFSGNSSENFYIKLNLNENFSLIDLCSNKICRSGMYLPPKEKFNYDYCFLLANANTDRQTGVSGYWSTGTNLNYGNEFENFLRIENTGSGLYCCYCSCLYNICLSVSEGRFNSCNIQAKTGLLNSESFIPFFSNIENCYIYSGVEFRYFPVTCILYLNNFYEIPNCCINLTLGITGKQINVNFPIRALSLDKVKIINEYETLESVGEAYLSASYSDINFLINSGNSNCINFLFPKIYNSNITGHESPNVSLSVYSKSCLQNNLKFIVDPFYNIKNDKNYGLNNFLFFIASELNCGTVYQQQYTGFSYGDSDYNFLMIDLQDEFFECCFQVPSGSGYFVFDERVSYRNIQFNDPLPYKNIKGNGYSFILPVSTGLKYFDCTNNSIGALCNQFNFNGVVNYLNTGLEYSGGSSGVLPLLDDQGSITGYYTGYFKNSFLNIFKENYSVNLNSQDIALTDSGRLICFDRSYTFSGIQPICLISNYPFLEIKNPLKTSELTDYDPNQEMTSGVVYYLYDINNLCDISLKFLAPESTLIESIQWSDESGVENKLNYLENSPEKGQISRNASLLKFKVKDTLANNNYNYCQNIFNCICFNVIGDL